MGEKKGSRQERLLISNVKRSVTLLPRLCKSFPELPVLQSRKQQVGNDKVLRALLQLRKSLEEHQRSPAFIVFDGETIFDLRDASDRDNMGHIQDEMFEMPFILRGPAAEKYFDVATFY